MGREENWSGWWQEYIPFLLGYTTFLLFPSLSLLLRCESWCVMDCNEAAWRWVAVLLSTWPCSSVTSHTVTRSHESRDQDGSSQHQPGSPANWGGEERALANWTTQIYQRGVWTFEHLNIWTGCRIVRRKVLRLCEWCEEMGNSRAVRCKLSSKDFSAYNLFISAWTRLRREKAAQAPWSVTKYLKYCIEYRD